MRSSELLGLTWWFSRSLKSGCDDDELLPALCPLSHTNEYKVATPVDTPMDHSHLPILARAVQNSGTQVLYRAFVMSNDKAFLAMRDYMPQWPLKVLILSSDPRDAGRLRLAQEHRDLQNAIRGTRSASLLDVSNEPSCRYSDITAALDRVDPHILHFSGHGGDNVLYFEDVRGTAKSVQKQALAKVLSHQKELQLIILNACFSLDQGQAFADAVGLAIVSEGSILDQDAIDFSREFYTALGYGQRSYIQAFERAKAALEMTGEMKVHLLQRGTPSVQDAPAHSSSPPEVDGFHVQFELTGLPVAGHFVDRDSEIESMEQSLLPTNVQTGRKMHILHGLGGIGKTQLAIAHARKHQHTYSAILWVKGNSRDTVLQSLSAFGRRAGVNIVSGSTAYAAEQGPDMEAEVAAILRWLALEGNHRWLMIFDNVDQDIRSSAEDSQAFDIASFLPQADHGSILITTRLPSLGEMGQSTEVGRLTLDQAQELLRCRSGLQASDDDMAKLVERLGYLPLALVQAGTYMRKTKTGCLKYIELYETAWSRLAAETPRLRDYENGSVQTTWMISYESVCQNATAGKLLQLWAYLNHQDVWYELFRRGCDDYPEELSWMQALASSEIDFKGIMEILLAYSLIEPHRDSESYSMHPVVHDWCAETISRGRRDLMLAALTVVGTAAPSQSEPGFWLLERRLLPHVDRCAQQINNLEGWHWLASTEALDASDNLGTLYVRQGKLVEADNMYRRALDGFEKIYGPEHTSNLNTIGNLGLLYMDQSKLVEAENMFQRALDGFEKAYGPEYKSTLNTVNNLGILYCIQGKLVEAGKMFQRTLDGYEKANGPEHISNLNTVGNLGLLYMDQSKLVEAEKMFRRALDGKEKAYGPEHKSTLDTLNNLGILYEDQGKLMEAEKIYRRALDGKEKALGPDHINTLNTVNNLGVLYEIQGKLVEAEKMFRRALRGYTDAYGSDHPDTQRAARKLARLIEGSKPLEEEGEDTKSALEADAMRLDRTED